MMIGVGTYLEITIIAHIIMNTYFMQNYVHNDNVSQTQSLYALKIVMNKPTLMQAI